MITPTHLPGLSICCRRGYWPQSAVALHSVICYLWTKDDQTSSVMSKCRGGYAWNCNWFLCYSLRRWILSFKSFFLKMCLILSIINNRHVFLVKFNKTYLERTCWIIGELFAITHPRRMLDSFKSIVLYFYWPILWCRFSIVRTVKGK